MATKNFDEQVNQIIGVVSPFLDQVNKQKFVYTVGSLDVIEAARVDLNCAVIEIEHQINQRKKERPNDCPHCLKPMATSVSCECGYRSTV